MKNLILLTSTLAAIMLATSCTIEKRVHLPGYHVDWANSNSSSKKQVKNTEEVEVANFETAKAEPAPETSTAPESSDEALPTFTTSTEVTASLESSPLTLASPVIPNRAEQRSTESSSSKSNLSGTTSVTGLTAASAVQSQHVDTRKVEGLGLAGMILGIAGWFMPVLALAIIMCILAIIFGAASLGKINRNPETYMGRGFAITSLILGILGMIIIFIIVAVA